MIWLCAFGLVALAVGYEGMSQHGVESLRPVLRWRGLLTTALTIALVLGVAQEPGGGHFVALFAGLVALGFAAWRQELAPDLAPALQPIDDALEPSEIVAVTASGAVPLRLLEQLRTARVHGSLLVHCRTANSTTAFASPPGAPLAALLPQTSGFEIGGPAAGLLGVGPRWDGIDGAAVAGTTNPLAVQPVALATAAEWKTERPDHPVLGLPGEPLPPRQGPPSLLPPAAEGIEAPWQLGRVTDDGWAPAEPDGVPGRWLGRWAARSRGVPGA